MVIAALFAGLSWAPWAGLGFAIPMILVSVLYYNPAIMLERQPGLVDGVEDLLQFTGLLFISATLLLYEVQGRTLQRCYRQRPTVVAASTRPSTAPDRQESPCRASSRSPSTPPIRSPCPGSGPQPSTT